MSTLNALLSACQAEQEPLLLETRERVAQWGSWLQPLSGSSPVGEDPVCKVYTSIFVRSGRDRMRGSDPSCRG
ncbi:hypothetical protein PAP10c_2060 [Pantoea agglomerans]|nr:hypothetical protein PAP10c_2060 [Pantoea agglomerans]